MNPFEPIIGSSFDSLAAQRFGWAGLNAQTENQNFARANSAQEQANNYFASMAANRQAAMDRQAQMDWTAQQAADADRQATAERAQRAHQFDLGLKTQKEQQAEALQNTGQALATMYAASKRQLDQVSKTAQDLQSEHDTLATEVSDLGKKIDKTPEETLKLQADNARLGALKKILPKALAAANTLEQRHLALSDNIQARGFVTDEEKGSLTHLETGKSWSFSKTLAAAKAAADAGTTTGTNDYFAPGAPPVPTQTATNAPAAASVSSAAMKANYANKLAQQHPDWTREQIMAQTMKDFAAGSGTQPIAGGGYF